MSQPENTVVTEEALLKSLTDLEVKAVNTAPAAAPAVAVETLQKSASDTLTDMASPNLRKAIDVSEVLEESIALMGVHVDRSLEALQKSIQGSAERDFAIVRVLGDLRKSIDANSEAIAKLLDQPGAPASTRPVTVDNGQVLTKSTTTSPVATPTKDHKDIRQGVLNGLERLVKSATANGSEGARLSAALIKFESTGVISDADMAAALKA